MSQPGAYVYWGDWYKDTRVLTLAARGGWVDLFGLLSVHGGSISWSIDEFSRFWGCNDETSMTVLAELYHHGTADISCDCHAHVTPMSRVCHAFVTPIFADGHSICNGIVTLTSRRITRESKARESNKMRQQRARDRQGRHRKVTHNVTASSQPNYTVLPSPSPSTEKNKSLIVSTNKSSRNGNSGHVDPEPISHEPLEPIAQDQAELLKRLKTEAGLPTDDEPEEK